MRNLQLPNQSIERKILLDNFILIHITHSRQSPC